MGSTMKEKEVSQLIRKDFLSDSELFRLLIYAIFLSFVGEALHDEESGENKGLELKHKLIESDLDSYRASGSCAILQLSEVCDNVAIGRYVSREYLSLANSILGYIIKPRVAIQKEVHMTKDERVEVATIERKAEEMISILSAYIYGRALSIEERQDLDWIRDRIFAVCRNLFHDKFSTHYRLTPVERPFFMNNAERYLMGNAIPFSNIQNGERCGVEINFAIYTLVDYLNNIARECRVAEHDDILPKEESFDVEY